MARLVRVHLRRCRPLNLRSRQVGFLNLRPLLQALPGEFAVRLGHNGVDELLFGRRRVVAQLEDRVAPVAVSGFAVRIDGNRPRKPLGRGIQIVLHIGCVAGKKRRLVELAVCLGCGRVLGHCCRKISRRVGLLRLRQQGLPWADDAGIERLIGIENGHLPHKFGRIAQRNGALGRIPLPYPHRLDLGRIAQLGCLGAQAVCQPLKVELRVGMRLGQILIERQSLRPLACLEKGIRPGRLIVLSLNRRYRKAQANRRNPSPHDVPLSHRMLGPHTPLDRAGPGRISMTLHANLNLPACGEFVCNPAPSSLRYSSSSCSFFRSACMSARTRGWPRGWATIRPA